MNSPDTTQSAWDWTVTLLTIYGKTCHLVPPCAHLPTYRHVSKADRKTEALSKARASNMKAVNLVRKPGEEVTKVNNHIWRKWTPKELK